jgi:hypothetical protein
MVAQPCFSPSRHVLAADRLQPLGGEDVVEPAAANETLPPHDPTARIDFVPVKAAKHISQSERLKTGQDVSLTSVPS